MKKRMVIISSILLLIIIGVGIYYTYGTLAAGTSTSEGEVYNFDITDDTTVTVPANSSKIVFFKIKNTNNGTVRYGIGYTNKSNIEVLAYNDGFDEMTGLIKKNEYKFIKLRVINNTSSSQSTKISTILGYENGGDLIVPSDKGLVDKGYTPPLKLATYITNLYNNASRTEVTNNSITYNYANIYDTNGGLMNDRLGGTTTSLDDGNIRYYGANPNNYIYFNCSDYKNQSADTCELWRIIGVFGDKVKIIREDKAKVINNEIADLLLYSWNTSDSSVNEGYGKNDWSQADLMKLLNPGYESESIGGSLYWNSQSGTCFSNFNNETTPCDFTGSGLKNNATRNKIAEVTWNLGGIEDYLIYPDQFYNYERGTNVFDGNPTLWMGRVALMYASDYGYAGDFSGCADYVCRNNWLAIDNGGGSPIVEWTLNSVYYDPLSLLHTGEYSFGVGDPPSFPYPSRPTLFLNADQAIEVGNAGSSTDPFRLAP